MPGINCEPRFLTVSYNTRCNEVGRGKLKRTTRLTTLVTGTREIFFSKPRRIIKIPTIPPSTSIFSQAMIMLVPFFCFSRLGRYLLQHRLPVLPAAAPLDTHFVEHDFSRDQRRHGGSAPEGKS